MSISACHLRALRPEKITHEVVLKRLAELSKERFYVNTGRTLRALRRKAQNNIMIPRRAVFEMIRKPVRRIVNATEGIDNQKTQKPNPNPFAPDEVEVFLCEMILE
ncbi:hypothetical protein H9K76_13825 [Diaphorobacter ruginosibacter]|uniref:Uncharacterized protein n=1 Tax=Diaphorobacter ruginosibacter TaxID=1715720 RepID=A0A7G9RJD3_9BURK|nr:hypothetical protein [Diaphorobacter ruginosibacter]QNN55708.1 hypothetical protein H9K76_13825 [Diaphorobacter ruginosibacter]